MSVTSPTVPLTHPGRLSAVRATGLLGNAPVAGLERVARLAARSLDAPVAQINLLTIDQQVPVAACAIPRATATNARPGAEPDWTTPVGLDSSFCQHVVVTGTPLVVADARVDERWRDNRATRESGLVAYASVPVRSAAHTTAPGERYVIGTVCVVDFVPRIWTEQHLMTLADLAHAAEAEVARHAGEQRLRAVFDEAPAMLFTVGEDGSVLEVNRFGAESLGYTVADLIGQPVSTLFHPEDREPAATRVAETLAAGGAPRSWELRKVRRDGSVLWVRETARAVRMADGRPGALILCEDVTAAKEAEVEHARLAEEARSARDLLWRVLEQAPVAIAVQRGPMHTFALVNPLYRRLVGGRDVIGHDHDTAFPEIVQQGALTMLDGVYRTGTPFVGRGLEIHYDRRGDGVLERGYFDISSQPLVESDGTVTGVITVAAETTEEVRARQDAEAARAEAERQRAEALEASVAKTRFLANMSHELRTPLNAIQGHVQLLEMGLHGPVTAEQRTALDRVARAQQHLLALINDVLNFSKLEAGRVEYHVAPTRVVDVLRDIIPMIEPQVRAKGHALHVSLPEDRGEDVLSVLADREKLGQILLNLLSNAVKFTPPGGRIEVALTGREGEAADPEVAYLSVRDDGIGIPRERQDAIFDPFVQVREGLTRPYEGTGLGLAISRDLARGMGGDLRVRSWEGTGSTFTVSLRRAKLTPRD
ncbi:MAG TPA: PAS domain S-box protein [Gemmatirosa sp.]